MERIESRLKIGVNCTLRDLLQSLKWKTHDGRDMMGSPPIGGAVRNAVSLIPELLPSTVLDIT